MGLFAGLQVFGNDWYKRLYTPTQVQKIGDTYFIVDCWHHRVLYSTRLEDRISQWHILTDNIIGPHTIASDGEWFLVDDTERDAIQVFKKIEGAFIKDRDISCGGGRPHFVRYDDKTKRFYCILSHSAEICVLENTGKEIELVQKQYLPDLYGSYVRAINLFDGLLYTTSGPRKVLGFRYDDLSFQVEQSFPVPDDLAGMNYVDKIADDYYVSIYTNLKGDITPMLLQMKSLSGLSTGEYSSIGEQLGIRGVPYFISHFNGKNYITEIDTNSGLVSFNASDSSVQVIQSLHHFPGHSRSSEKRRFDTFGRDNKEEVR